MLCQRLPSGLQQSRIGQALLLKMSLKRSLAQPELLIGFKN